MLIIFAGPIQEEQSKNSLSSKTIKLQTKISIPLFIDIAKEDRISRIKSKRMPAEY